MYLAKRGQMATSTSRSTDFNPKQLRAALGRYATGVAVVMARTDDGRTAGMTINSFASVSLDPPLVLWSMQSGTPSSSIFRAAGAFTVSILGAEHQELAMTFAKSGDAKLEHVAVVPAPSGQPHLGDVVAWFDCATDAVHAGGDHDIFVGRVTAFGQSPGRTLTFHDGRFFTSGE